MQQDLNQNSMRTSGIGPQPALHPSADIPFVPSALTPRETEVLRLMAEGLTSKAIAAKLQISFKTAVCHRSRILQKLGVDSTVMVVRWAIREGIVEA